MEVVNLSICQFFVGFCGEGRLGRVFCGGCLIRRDVGSVNEYGICERLEAWGGGRYSPEMRPDRV